MSEIWRSVRGFTLADPARIAAIESAVAYLQRGDVPGDFVECGVYRGGSSMAAALALLQDGPPFRRIWLYDTFDGMTPPEDVDVRAVDGRPAAPTFERLRRDGGGSDWDRATITEVERNMASTGYPMDRVRMIPGRVEDTLLDEVPSVIALLRLDTDWYASTRCELEQLFPRLSPGGVLIVDDYGYWRGAREAVDAYFAENAVAMLMVPIGGGAVMGVKAPTR